MEGKTIQKHMLRIIDNTYENSLSSYCNIKNKYLIFYPLNNGIVSLDFDKKFIIFGYGVYRQMSRRRFSVRLNDKLFLDMTNLLKIKTTIIESFGYYRDLFMSSKVLDQLNSING